MEVLQTRTRLHGLSFAPQTPEEMELNRQAGELIRAAKKQK